MTLPGFSPKAPALPPPPPPAPTRSDPATQTNLADASKKQRASELRRKGRKSTRIAPRAGELGEAPVARPEARAAKVLGG